MAIAMNGEIVPMVAIPRSVSQLRGIKRYYTGLPCKYGHIDVRLSVDGRCYECARQKAKRKYHHDPKYREYQNQWRKDNAEKVAKYAQESEKRNIKNRRLQSLKWYYKNKESANQRKKQWDKNNPDKVAFYRIKRRYIEKQATPAWANKQKIRRIYLNRPTGFQVDHIIPLNSPIVCGLHVEDNLQYLPKFENVSKGNKLLPEVMNNG